MLWCHRCECWSWKLQKEAQDIYLRIFAKKVVSSQSTLETRCCFDWKVHSQLWHGCYTAFLAAQSVEALRLQM